MSTLKRFSLLTLLVLGATLFANTPARAQFSENPIDLVGVVGVDDPDYGASGQLRILGIKPGYTVGPSNGFVTPIYFECHVNLQCSGLTQGATYVFPGGKFRAGKDGSVDITRRHDVILVYFVPWWGAFEDGWWHVGVYRLNRDGSSTTVLASD